MKRKILVFGSRGFFGRAVVTALASQSDRYETIAVTHEQVDITNSVAVDAMLTAHRPDFVVNAAGITGNANCSKNPQRAWEVNARGAAILAVLCRKLGCILLHPSSVVVFDGASGYYGIEARPKSLWGNPYAEFKARAEYEVQASGAEFIMPRITMAYGPPHERDTTNFLKSVMTALRVKINQARYFADQYTNPVHIDDVAASIVKLIDYNFRGIVHFGGPEVCSMYDFAVEAKAIFQLPGELGETTVVGTTYPPNMTLNAESSLNLGITFCDIEEGLRRCKQAMQNR